MDLTQLARMAKPPRPRPSPASAEVERPARPEPSNGNGLDQLHLLPQILRHRVLVPVEGLHQGALSALRYAQSISDDVTAVHVSMDPAETEALQQAWPSWGAGIRLVVLESPHDMVLEPLLEYIQHMMTLRQNNEIINVVVPQSVRPRWWTNLIRTQMGMLLRLSLPYETGIVITDVPYVLDGQEV